jgi:hypothetical protein
MLWSTSPLPLMNVAVNVVPSPALTGLAPTTKLIITGNAAASAASITGGSAEPSSAGGSVEPSITGGSVELSIAGDPPSSEPPVLDASPLPVAPPVLVIPPAGRSARVSGLGLIEPPVPGAPPLAMVPPVLVMPPLLAAGESAGASGLGRIEPPVPGAPPLAMVPPVLAAERSREPSGLELMEPPAPPAPEAPPEPLTPASAGMRLLFKSTWVGSAQVFVVVQVCPEAQSRLVWH